MYFCTGAQTVLYIHMVGGAVTQAGPSLFSRRRTEAGLSRAAFVRRTVYFSRSSASRRSLRSAAVAHRVMNLHTSSMSSTGRLP